MKRPRATDGQLRTIIKVRLKPRGREIAALAFILMGMALCLGLLAGAQVLSCEWVKPTPVLKCLAPMLKSVRRGTP